MGAGATKGSSDLEFSKVGRVEMGESRTPRRLSHTVSLHLSHHNSCGFNQFCISYRLTSSLRVGITVGITVGIIGITHEYVEKPRKCPAIGTTAGQAGLAGRTCVHRLLMSPCTCRKQARARPWCSWVRSRRNGHLHSLGPTQQVGVVAAAHPEPASQCMGWW